MHRMTLDLQTTNQTEYGVYVRRRTTVWLLLVYIALHGILLDAQHDFGAVNAARVTSTSDNADFEYCKPPCTE